MNIQRFDTVTKKVKPVLFTDVVRNFKEKMTNVAITYALLRNRILKNGRYEFKRV